MLPVVLLPVLSLPLPVPVVPVPVLLLLFPAVLLPELPVVLPMLSVLSELPVFLSFSEDVLPAFTSSKATSVYCTRLYVLSGNVTLKAAV